MIIDNTGNLDEVVFSKNVNKGQQFNFEVSGKAFEIFSSGIYEHKIRAVIRELSCNAYDAHIEAGRKDVPFTVHLPTELETYFTVKDEGIGLDDDGVMTIYTTYFKSTKSNSNDCVGAFGLGSKSPFAYTSTFNIIAIFDGVKRSYIASIGDMNIPEITRMSEEPTDELNGVSITIPVKSSDISEFYREAKEIYQYFEVRPIIQGNTIESYTDYDVVYKNDSGGVLLNTYSSYIKIIQGNVCYNYGYYECKDGIPEDLRSFHDALNNDRKSIVLNVPIGTLQVAVSRESLSLDDDTSEKLFKIISTFLRKSQKFIEYKVLNECKNADNYGKALEIYNNNKEIVSFNEITVGEMFDFKSSKHINVKRFDKLKKIQIVVERNYDYVMTNLIKKGLKTTNIVKITNVNLIKKFITPIIFIADVKHYYQRQIIMEHSGQKLGNILVSYPVKKNTKDQVFMRGYWEQVYKLYNDVSASKIVFMSDLLDEETIDVVEPIKRDYSNVKRGVFKEYTVLSILNDHTSHNNHEVDLNDGEYFYVRYNRNTLTKNCNNVDYDLPDLCILCDMTDIQVYSLDTTQYNRIKNKSNWKCFIDYVENNIHYPVISDINKTYNDYMSHEYIVDKLGDVSYFNKVYKIARQVGIYTDDFISNKPSISEINKYNDFRNKLLSIFGIELHEFDLYIDYTGSESDNEIFDILSDDIRGIINDYPMLTMIDTFCENIDIINEYVIMVNNQTMIINQVA